METHRIFQCLGDTRNHSVPSPSRPPGPSSLPMEMKANARAGKCSHKQISFFNRRARARFLPSPFKPLNNKRGGRNRETCFARVRPPLREFPACFVTGRREGGDAHLAQETALIVKDEKPENPPSASGYLILDASFLGRDGGRKCPRKENGRTGTIEESHRLLS